MFLFGEKDAKRLVWWLGLGGLAWSGRAFRCPDLWG